MSLLVITRLFDLNFCLEKGSKDKADKPPDEKGVADWAHLKSSEILHGVDGIWKVGFTVVIEQQALNGI